VSAVSQRQDVKMEVTRLWERVNTRGGHHVASVEMAWMLTQIEERLAREERVERWVEKTFGERPPGYMVAVLGLGEQR
jgi:hypothetical protein